MAQEKGQLFAARQPALAVLMAAACFAYLAFYVWLGTAWGDAQANAYGEID